MMTRRKFLVAGLSTVPLAAGSMASPDRTAWALRRSGAWLLAFVQSPEERLLARFDYLNLDPAGVARYVADCRRYQPDFSRWRPLHEDACTRFLLSTDFFRHDADESRRIHYIGFFDPSVTPCSNPLARFDEDA